MGPRAGLDWCGKSRPPPGFDPRTVQPVTNRYTDYATRPTIHFRYTLKYGIHRMRRKYPTVFEISKHFKVK